MDFDHDGINDLISGSYDPGDLYLFRGLGGGEFAAVTVLKDEADVPLVHHPAELARYEAVKNDEDADPEKSIQDRIASFGSWPEMVDWDGDGDLDCLIGSFAGELFLRINVGTRAEPRFSPESVPVEADGKALRVSGHASPAVTDWDRDGVWDLVVGSSTGQVDWFRNQGTTTEPRFAAAAMLLPAVSDTKFSDQEVPVGGTAKRGSRAQICVTDYNGDGWPDLVVGDHSEIRWLRELTEAERAKLDELVAEQNRIKLQFQAAPAKDDPEAEAEREKMIKEWEQLEEGRKDFYRETRTSSFIWLFLRKPPIDPSDESADPMKAGDRSNDKDKAGDSRNDDQSSAGPRRVQWSGLLEEAVDDPGRWQLTVTANIEEGWHLYPTLEAGQSGKPVELELELPQGWVADGDWQAPAGEPAGKGSRGRLLKQRAVWRQVLRTTDLPGPERAGVAPVVRVRYDFQACNDQLCLPSQTGELEVRGGPAATDKAH